MKYRLRKLLLVTILGPPVLAWLYFTYHPESATFPLALLAGFLAWMLYLTFLGAFNRP